MIIIHFNVMLNLDSQWAFMHTKKMEIKLSKRIKKKWECKSRENISMQKYLSVYIYISIQLPYIMCIVEDKAVVCDLLL